MPTIGVKKVRSVRRAKIKHQVGPRAGVPGGLRTGPPDGLGTGLPGIPRRTRTRTFRGSVGSVTMNEWNAI